MEKIEFLLTSSFSFIVVTSILSAIQANSCVNYADFLTAENSSRFLFLKDQLTLCAEAERDF